jgi:hypothetical protein
MIGVILGCDDVTLLDIGTVIAVPEVVGVVVGAEVDDVEVDAVAAAVIVLLNCAATKSALGQPSALHGFDLQHPWNEPAGVWSTQVNQFDPDGHLALSSLVAATPPAGKPAAKRLFGGHPSEHGLLVQQPWNVGLVIRHSNLYYG